MTKKTGSLWVFQELYTLVQMNVSMQNSQRHLLVVEDSTELQELLRALFELEGYVVHCSSNGLEAMNYLNQAQVMPDLILLDVMMPIMDGFEFRKEQLKDPKTADVPVVVMTADNSHKIQECFSGKVDFIRKPAEIEQILEIVSRNCSLTH